MIRRGNDRQPLYLQVAHALAKAISSNRFDVGSLLPTEEELCKEYNVSRHTVREAIRHLRSQGLLSARRGVGTRVEARDSVARYTQSLHSLAEVSQYAHETVLDVTDSKRVTLDAELAEKLGTRAGKAWMHVQGMRMTMDKEPICWTDIYIDRTFGGVVKDIGVRRIAVYTLIERRYGATVVEVQQDVAATLVPKEHAGVLGVKAGSPALLITRKYFGAGGRLIEVALSLHPADRFVYSMRLKRDSA